MNKIIYEFDTILDHIRWKIEDLEEERKRVLDDDLPDWELHGGGFELELLKEMLRTGEGYE